jgi:hypothetical protein
LQNSEEYMERKIEYTTPFVVNLTEPQPLLYNFNIFSKLSTNIANRNAAKLN